MEREVGGGIGMGNTCKSMADSCQCMAKSLQYCKVISLQLIKKIIKKIKKKDSILRSQSVVPDIIFMNAHAYIHAYIHVDIYV